MSQKNNLVNTPVIMPIMGDPFWYHRGIFEKNGEVAALGLSFINQRYFVNKSVKQFNQIASFDRSSKSVIVDRDSALKFIESGVERIDFSTNFQGVKIEEEVSNLITNPKTVGGSGWSNYNATVTTNNDIAPDGTQTATRFVATGQYANTTQQPSASASTAYTGSMWVKVISDNGSSPVLQVYDGSTYKNVPIDKTKTGWVRYDVGMTIGASANFFRLQITDSGSANWTELALWFGQVTEGDIVRSESEGTKNADDIQISSSDFTDFYNQDEGTVVVDFKVSDTDDDAKDRTVFEISTGSTANRYSLFIDKTSDKVIVTTIDGGAWQGNMTSQILAASGRIRAVFAYKENDFALSVNGEAVITDTSRPVFTASEMNIGKNSSDDNYLNGVVYQAAYYDKRLTDSEIHEISMQYVDYLIEGDSYGRDHLYDLLNDASVFDRVSVNSAVGGSTLEQAVVRAEAHALAGLRPMIFCDGSPNGYDTVANDLARYQRVIDATDGNVVIISPVAHPSIVGGAFETFCDDMTDELLSQSWADKVVNGTEVAETLAGTTDRTATAYTDLFPDDVHPSDALTKQLIISASKLF